MKQSIRLVWLIIALSVFIFASVHEESQWRGKIEYEDGVKVIKNPSEPLYGEITFELEEDLSIGNEEDENCYFYKNIRLDVDSEGNIYVLDWANYRVQKFDKNGNFVSTIGRQGQGPGEFSDPHGLHIGKNDRVCVLDRQMIHVFDGNGRLEKCTSIQGIVSQYSYTDSGSVICRISKRTSEGMKEQIGLFSQEGEQSKSYIDSSLQVFKTKNTILIGGGPYNPRILFCPWFAGSAVYGHSSEYRLVFLDSLGEVSFIVEKEEAPEAITKKEKNEFYENMYESERRMRSRFPNRKSLSKSDIKKAYPLPKNKPFYIHLFSDEEGNVYVLRMFPLYIKKRVAEFDFFNNKGCYVHKVKVTMFPRIIRQGYFYREHWDQDKGFFRIKRYKIKNWEKIKEGL